MKEVFPCAVYTRKSSEDGLEQGFNSLDAQREACEAYILSQKAQGWTAVTATYDDGGFSGGNTERPALNRLLADIRAKQVRIIVVYKVDRLTRSLADFAKMVELFDAHGVSFVSVTQQFNTTSSMGRLTLNVLLSFAQFEREVTGERIRDKIAASKRKGMWMGGFVPIGYMPHERTLVIDEPQAEHIREIYRLYLELGCVRQLKAEVDRLGWITSARKTRRDNLTGGRPFSRGHLYRILSNPIYIGQIRHKEAIFPGQHPAIIDAQLWQAVQDRLAANLQGHRCRSKAADPSLLTGLLFDHQGQRLTPTHAKKGGRRYRYYLGQALPASDTEPTAKVSRLPAQELEGAVLRALQRFLTDKSNLVERMGTIPAKEAKSQLEYAAGLAKRLAGTSPGDKLDALKRIVKEITVHHNQLEIAVRSGAIWSPDDAAPDEQIISITVPVELKRCGSAVRLIVQAPGETVNRGPDPKLTALIAKAHRWFALLLSDDGQNIQTIAQKESVTSSYVTRVIYIAFMAPDIMQQIIRGHHPPDLNAMRLMRMLPLPLGWSEQRILLGMQN